MHAHVAAHGLTTDSSFCAQCLEGLFDTYGTFGVGFNGDLEKGGPKPLGARRANLSDDTRMYLEEVALNEQVCSLCSQFERAFWLPDGDERLSCLCTPSEALHGLYKPVRWFMQKACVQHGTSCQPYCLNAFSSTVLGCMTDA